MQKSYKVGIIFFSLNIFSISPCSDLFKSVFIVPEYEIKQSASCIKVDGFWVHAYGNDLLVSELDSSYFEHPYFKDVDQTIKTTVYAEILIKKAKNETKNNLTLSKKGSYYHEKIAKFLGVLKDSNSLNYQKSCIAQPILYDLQQLLNDYKK